jgi:hypothetical protein
MHPLAIEQRAQVQTIDQAAGGLLRPRPILAATMAFV